MRYKILVIFLLFLSAAIYAQGDYQKHLVLKGETVYAISRRYGVSVNEIYKLNPTVENILYEGSELLIPKSQNSSIHNLSNNSSDQMDGDKIYHIVQVGETKFGLSRKYGVTIESLERQNPQIVRLLMAGEKIVVQMKDANGVNFANLSNGNYYVVQPGDTKYGLSKKYNISIDELERLNPQIVSMLQTGHKLVLPSNENAAIVQQTPQIAKPADPVKPLKPAVEVPVTPAAQVPVKPVVEAPVNTTVISDATKDSSKYKNYEVQPKQTLFGLAKMAGLSQNQLIELNPNLANGVKIGMIIRVPLNATVPAATIPSAVVSNAAANPLNVQGKLYNSLNKVESKKIAFLFPVDDSDFASWLRSPKVLTTSDKPELKRATDFYLGAQIAIDSLKKLGLKIDEKYFASPSNAMLSLAKKNELVNQSLVFYPSADATVVKVEEYLNKNKIPLLSFYETAESERTSNGFVMLPGGLQLKIMMLDYVKSQGGKIIVVVDPSRKENVAFIKSNYPQVVFAEFDKKGIVEINSIKNALDKSQKNFVVLDTEKVGLILDVTTFLMKESSNYPIQLVSLEPKEAIENENLSEMRFVVLKMIYPSAAFNNDSVQVDHFKTRFNSKYNSVPSIDAMQGFDCTFDGLLRLYQTQSFETIAKDEETKQLLYRFRYTKSQSGAYNNIGGYILQFDANTDSKIVN